jgi:uncharacterized protein
MGPLHQTLPQAPSSAGARAAQRWRFAWGPIDLLIGADGVAAACLAAHDAAWARFVQVLPELVAELPRLRQPVEPGEPVITPSGVLQELHDLQGPIARRMWRACARVREAATADFITPMAAVAGAVAEDLIKPFVAAGCARAWVNNGGDIALHLARGEQLQVGLVADIGRRRAALDGRFSIHHADATRGIATSGWRGRSLSLGIADAVTVLAKSAALADAAATLVANAVDVSHPLVQRAPASSRQDDSDLGERLVTVDVPSLPPPLVQQALQAGLARAQQLQVAGVIEAAVLCCQGQWLSLDDPARRQALLPLAA